MLNFKNRKGVSEVVANVLIVLLVIVGIAVIWSVVKPTIDKGAKGISSDCFTVSVEPVSCASYVASTGGATPTLGTATVNIKRNPGAGNFEAVEVVIEDGTTTQKIVPTTAVTSTTLGELSTTPISVTGITTTATTGVKANIVLRSGENLCQITTQPVNCA